MGFASPRFGLGLIVMAHDRGMSPAVREATPGRRRLSSPAMSYADEDKLRRLWGLPSRAVW
jgi:hypothetical protein